jgi:hypothetical protein
LPSIRKAPDTKGTLDRGAGEIVVVEVYGLNSNEGNSIDPKVARKE